MSKKNIGKCNHCDKEGNLNDEKICLSCRKNLKRNPDHIPRHKKHIDFVCQCGSTEVYCKNMCKKCYDTSPDRYTPETIEKMSKNRLEKNPVYNRNRGEKRNPNNYQPRPDRSDFVCQCGSTEHSSKGYCKTCAHRELYGPKYENSNLKKRKISRMDNPQWQETARENYSKRMCEKLQMTALEIDMKWRKVRSICLKRDDFTCQACGFTKYPSELVRLTGDSNRIGNQGDLQVHHIFPKAKYYGLFFDVGTLTSLCKKCHDVITYKKFKKNTRSI